ncbi:MAG: hypothetical protein JWP26_3872 [Devosia sp.]|nr:hypothetical protein [Devosia sp.]MDB5588902.1 hypothetical protein [Devosia sp.]
MPVGRFPGSSLAAYRSRLEPWRVRRARASLALIFTAVLVALCGAVGPAQAQEDSQHRLDIWDLKLGSAAADLPEEAFIDYACGTNGGPPGTPLGGFVDFALCAPEADGLHEVAFRYDDELEYRLLARRDLHGAETNGGTSVYDYAVIASALFDDEGVLRGVRAVTDDRTTLRNRASAYQMAEAVLNRFGLAGWACVDVPASRGEEPLAGQYVNKSCSKVVDGATVAVNAHRFRRRGETETNRFTGQVVRGQFESSSEFEIHEN